MDRGSLNKFGLFMHRKFNSTTVNTVQQTLGLHNMEGNGEQHPTRPHPAQTVETIKTLVGQEQAGKCALCKTLVTGQATGGN